MRSGKLSCDETGEDDIECMKSNAKDKDKEKEMVKEMVKEKDKLSINNFIEPLICSYEHSQFSKISFRVENLSIIKAAQ